MKKIIISIFVICLMLMSSVMATNIIHKKGSSMIMRMDGNVLITEFYNNRTIEVDNAGNVIWEKNGFILPHDSERLPNGNTLITSYGDQYVIEVNKAGTIVWEKTDLNMPMDAERLPNGNTLIAEYGGHRVIEVNSSGDIVWSKTGLGKPFDAERLPNGNTLIVDCTWPEGAKVIEVDIDGNEVWNKSGLSGPVDAERLPNGNTLITEHIGKSVIEVNSAGTIVWAMTGLGHPKDAERLPNGNTLIAECGANRVIEVDVGGNIVWEKAGLFYPTDVENLFNYPPNAPDIEGPANGKMGKSYNYTFNSFDPNEDVVKYHIDWGDSKSDTTGFYPSGADVTISHTWVKKGTYKIKVKAEDIFGLYSSESILEVTMPRDKNINIPFLKFLQYHPNMFPVLRLILIWLGL